MIVSENYINLLLSWIGNISFLMLFLFAAYQANWRAIKYRPERLHLILGATLYLLVLWSLTVSINKEIQIHLLGVTFLVLMLGFRFAIIVGALVYLVLLILGRIDGSTIGVSAWITLAIPAIVLRLWLHAVSRLRVKNVFVYLLGVGFAGAIVSTAVAIAAGFLFVSIFLEASRVTSIALEDWPIVTLLLFPEGFINGMLTSAITVYKPHWMKTYDEDFYLGAEGDDQH